MSNMNQTLTMESMYWINSKTTNNNKTIHIPRIEHTEKCNFTQGVFVTTRPHHMSTVPLNNQKPTDIGIF